MIACIQRVSEASVTIDGEVVGRIGRGLLVLLGVAPSDSVETARQLADKCLHLRIFEDEQGKMNRSLLDVEGLGGAERAGLLAVSQFTLLGDCRKGRRPSFVGAAPPEQAEQLYDEFIDAAKTYPINVQTGTFRAHMHVALVNDGPVTLLVQMD